jgi:hypothetical protein
MRQIPVFVVLLCCAAQPKTQRPYQDAPVAVAVAAGTGSVIAGAAAAAVVTVAVGTVVVGAEQFPDPPAGTPEPETASPPQRSPDHCGSCSCYGKGLSADIGTYHYEDGAGATVRTRRTCWQDCKKAFPNATGYRCTGDKSITWVE